VLLGSSYERPEQESCPLCALMYEAFQLLHYVRQRGRRPTHWLIGTAVQQVIVNGHRQKLRPDQGLFFLG
jgi:hypothetical protein